MKTPKVLIARNEGEYHIKVEGRATFETSLPLRTFANSFEGEELKAIYVDLSGCIGMDSTFMGVLAMIGLKVRKIGAPMHVINADENNKKLLNGLGLQKLFVYSEKTGFSPDEKWRESSIAADKMEKAETVLEAHETLMEVDRNNIPKFKNVVEFIKKDLEKEDTGVKS